MSKFTKEMVDSYADKLLIGLTPEENKMVLDEFELIDKGIDLINDIEGISSVEPMTHALDGIECELREDKVSEVLTIDEVLKNAGKTEGREVEVPKVVD
ncbi:MAG: aspartyl/glutamyl-tRNA amidotransferase subunit C [Bacilli bacterium]|nr:aspartyl/glutamyl-tRNA amidotransferase subunit C [Bacilli bacterium]